MHLNISGFLKGDVEDDSLKYKYKFDPSLNDAVLRVMKWISLEESPPYPTELTAEDIREIENATGIELPSDLILFIGVRSGPARV